MASGYGAREFRVWGLGRGVFLGFWIVAFFLQDPSSQRAGYHSPEATQSVVLGTQGSTACALGSSSNLAFKSVTRNPKPFRDIGSR